MVELTMESLARRVERVERRSRWAIGLSVVLAVALVLAWIELNRTPAEMRLANLRVFGEIVAGSIKSPTINASHVDTGHLQTRSVLLTAGYPGWDPVFIVIDRADRHRIRLSLSSDGLPNLILYDEQGSARTVVGSTTTVLRATGVKEKLPESTITLFNKAGKVIWSAP